MGYSVIPVGVGWWVLLFFFFPHLPGAPNTRTLRSCDYGVLRVFDYGVCLVPMTTVCFIPVTTVNFKHPKALNVSFFTTDFFLLLLSVQNCRRRRTSSCFVPVITLCFIPVTAVHFTPQGLERHVSLLPNVQDSWRLRTSSCFIPMTTASLTPQKKPATSCLFATECSRFLEAANVVMRHNHDN